MSKRFLIFAVSWHHWSLVLLRIAKANYANYANVTWQQSSLRRIQPHCNQYTIVIDRERSSFEKVFSKFRIEKPKYVLCKRGRAHFEAETSIVSLPLLEAYDERIRHLLAENYQLRARKVGNSKIIQSLETELIQKRSEVFQLQQELQLLREEVASTRQPVNPANNTVKFNVSRHSYWELDKSTRSLKRKKIRQHIQKAVEILPAEFKPVEVSIITLYAKFFISEHRHLFFLCYSFLSCHSHFPFLICSIVISSPVTSRQRKVSSLHNRSRSIQKLLRSKQKLLRSV